MVKTHNKTGLKYLCKTQQKDHAKYLGSGKLWRKHLKVNGEDITTAVIFETHDKEELKSMGIYYSKLWNVTGSDEWANMKDEEGDGGDTVSSKFWITDGKTDKYCDKTSPIPEGWRKGRSNCVFKDIAKQREFSLRSDRQKAGDSIKKAWQEGRFVRDHSKCGSKGEDNPSKRKDVREKIGIKNSKAITVKGTTFPSIKDAVTHFGVPRHTIDKWRKDEGSYNGGKKG